MGALALGRLAGQRLVQALVVGQLAARVLVAVQRPGRAAEPVAVLVARRELAGQGALEAARVSSGVGRPELRVVAQAVGPVAEQVVAPVVAADLPVGGTGAATGLAGWAACWLLGGTAAVVPADWLAQVAGQRSRVAGQRRLAVGQRRLAVGQRRLAVGQRRLAVGQRRRDLERRRRLRQRRRVGSDGRLRCPRCVLVQRQRRQRSVGCCGNDGCFGFCRGVACLDLGLGRELGHWRLL